MLIRMDPYPTESGSVFIPDQANLKIANTDPCQKWIGQDRIQIRGYKKIGVDWIWIVAFRHRLVVYAGSPDPRQKLCVYFRQDPASLKMWKTDPDSRVTNT